MVSWVMLVKWLRRGPTVTGDGFESWKILKKFKKRIEKFIFRYNQPRYYVYKTNHITTKKKRWMVKVYQHHHEFLVRFLRPERQIRHDRHDKGEVHETREREGGPRTTETWYVSRHYELRTEVWRGGTPKVRKL